MVKRVSEAIHRQSLCFASINLSSGNANIMHRASTIIVTLLTSLLFTGCASIVSGTTQEIKVDSNPPGATVYVGEHMGANMKNKVAVGVTPMKVKISRKDGVIQLEKAGFEPAFVPLNSKMNPWVWGDVAMLSLLSTSIDSSTGANNEYDPGEYMVDLKPAAK